MVQSTSNEWSPVFFFFPSFAFSLVTSMSEDEQQPEEDFAQVDYAQDELEEDDAEKKGEEDEEVEGDQQVVITSGGTQRGEDRPGGGPPKPRSRDKYTTTRFLTKYERARVLGTRALQISMGAPCTVALDGETDPLRIAQKELQQRKLPFVVRRFLPDNTYEDWKLNELTVE